MATKAKSATPEGMHSTTPYFFFNGNCREAVDFYKRAFNAEILGHIVPAPDGKSVWHVLLKIGDSNIMMADADNSNGSARNEENKGMAIWLYTQNCNEIYDNAVSEGCSPEMPMTDMFWGDRMGKVKDPFGCSWIIAAREWDYTEEEMRENQNQMMSRMTGR
jgi:PhnB protein